MTDKELLSITELNIKEFSQFKLIEKESNLQFISKKIEIPTYIAKYLIWRFNKSEIIKFDDLFKITKEKQFSIPSTIFKLNIPNPIPILFTYKNDNKFELSFSSYGEINVNIIENQIYNAIKYLDNYKTYNFYLDKSYGISIEILNDKYLNSENLFGSTFLDVTTINEAIPSNCIIIFYKSEEISKIKLIEINIFNDLIKFIDCGDWWLLDGQIRSTIGYTDHKRETLKEFSSDYFQAILKGFIKIVEKRNIMKYSFFLNFNKWKQKKELHIKCHILPKEYMKELKDELNLPENEIPILEKTYEIDCFSKQIQEIFNSKKQLKKNFETSIGQFVIHEFPNDIGPYFLFSLKSFYIFEIHQIYEACNQIETEMNFKGIQGFSIAFIPIDGKFLIGIRIDFSDFNKFFSSKKMDEKKWKYPKERNLRNSFKPILTHELKPPENFPNSK